MNILVVDDEEVYIALFQHIIEPTIDCTVTYAQSYEECMEMDLNEFDLILSDHHLNGSWDSIDVYRQCQAVGFQGKFVVNTVAAVGDIMVKYIHEGIKAVAVLPKGNTTSLRRFLKAGSCD